jgi:hypothetical protein
VYPPVNGSAAAVAFAPLMPSKSLLVTQECLADVANLPVTS